MGCFPGRDGMGPMGAGHGQEILPAPLSLSPPESGCLVLVIIVPLFSDTYERSRRDTAGKLLAISLRFFSASENHKYFAKKCRITLDETKYLDLI